MNVEFISTTQPAPHLVDRGIKTAEDLIVYTARVSSPQNQETMSTAPRLLKYCLDKGHWSVFQMADMTVEIETSVAISLQILRHWSMVMADHGLDVQQFSQRYASVDAFESYAARRQDTTNRQNSVDDLSDPTKEWFNWAQESVWEYSKHLYDDAIDAGIAKECARFLLPLNTRTRFYLKGSCRSWIHYLRARTYIGAQKEHRDIAEAAKSIFNNVFPNVGEVAW